MNSTMTDAARMLDPRALFAAALASRTLDAQTPQDPSSQIDPSSGKGESVAVLIKRYRNRRLYDTGRSAYITLDDLARDLAEGREVKVIDAATDEDLTRRTMVQVLLTDAHVHKLDFLPDDFLRTLIRLEDQSLIRLFSHYIKMTLSSFAVAQSAMNQNLELLRNMAPGPTDFMSGLAGFISGRGRKGAPAAPSADEPPADEPPEG